MRHGDSYPLDVIAKAATTVVGWVVVVTGTLIIGFCCGCWIGDGEVTGFHVMFYALAWVPLVWLWHPTIFIAYAVTALAIYLPMRFESIWLYLTALIATFVTWLTIVACIVRATGHGKFWHW
jgi:hypothetical protein